MTKLDRALSVIDKINEVTGKCLSYLALIMMIFVVYEVILRYCFNKPTIWSMEINQYILCGYTALAGGYALLYRSHVNVDIIYQRFNPRTRALVDLLTFVFFFVFILILIWKSGGMALEAWEYGERSESLLEAPLFPSMVVIPIGGILILLQGVAKFIRDLRFVITGTEPEGPSTGMFQVERREK